MTGKRSREAETGNPDSSHEEPGPLKKRLRRGRARPIIDLDVGQDRDPSSRGQQDSEYPAADDDDGADTEASFSFSACSSLASLNSTSGERIRSRAASPDRHSDGQNEEGEDGGEAGGDKQDLLGLTDAQIGAMAVADLRQRLGSHGIPHTDAGKGELAIRLARLADAARRKEKRRRRMSEDEQDREEVVEEVEKGVQGEVEEEVEKDVEKEGEKEGEKEAARSHVRRNSGRSVEDSAAQRQRVGGEQARDEHVGEGDKDDEVADRRGSTADVLLHALPGLTIGAAAVRFMEWMSN